MAAIDPDPDDLRVAPSTPPIPRREPRPAYHPEEGGGGGSDWWRVVYSVLIGLAVIAGLTWFFQG